MLGIAQESTREESVEALARIAREFDRELVHWCRRVRMAWDDALFGQLLAGAL